MTELFSQVPAAQSINANWGAFFALVAILVKDLFKWLTDIRRTRVEDKLEQNRQHSTDRIADSCEKQVDVLGEIKAELAKQHSLGTLRHSHVDSGIMALRVDVGVINEKLNSTCKGSCNLREPLVKPKNIFEQGKSFP